MPAAALPIPDQGLKGAFCLSRNLKQSGCSQVTDFCLFPWLQEDNTHTHALSGFLAMGNMSLEVHLPSPPQTGGIKGKIQGVQGAHLPSQSSAEGGGAVFQSTGVIWIPAVS